MAALDPTALLALQPVLRQLREIKGVREVRPGTFELRGKPLVRFAMTPEGLQAELRKAGGSGVDRYPVDSPPQHRKLVEDARLRAARLDED